MAIVHPPLPYPDTTLEPHISARTLSFHHGKHHKAYVDKTNELIAGTDHADKPVEEIVVASRGTHQGLFNNSAQAWNHAFYWECLKPNVGGPTGDLAAKIERDFGGLDALKAKMVDEAIKHFGSGWIWLVDNNGTLELQSLHDAETPLGTGVNPLLTVDVWEHAYYLDKQNDRKGYAQALVDNLANWEFAAENLARGTVWTYPTA